MCKRTEEISEQNEAVVFFKKTSLRKTFPQLDKTYISDTIRGMGSFRRNDFWESLVGQALVMIGRWYSRQPLTNH